MPVPLLLRDSQVRADVLTFAGRAARAGDAGIRLRAAGGVLQLSTALLTPFTLLDRTPTILGMRLVPVDSELECDVTVASVTASSEPGEVLLPDTALAPVWVGISPPQGGWERGGELDAAVAAGRAQWGIAAVTHALPTSPGEDVVRTVRAEVWGEADDELDGLPRGVAFAAHTLGFIGGEERAAVWRSGHWSRVAFARGHVLVYTRS
ncbi:MAG: hypothetical protein QM607_00745 [Microbacterium sp.]